MLKKIGLFLLWALLLVGTVVGAKISPKALLVSQLVFAGFALGTLLVNIVTHNRPLKRHRALPLQFSS